MQIKEPSPEHEEAFESSGYEDTDDDRRVGGVGGTPANNADDDSTDSEYGAGAGTDTSTGCGRTRKHLRDVGGKIGSFTSRMGCCRSWFCLRPGAGQPGSTSAADRQRTPSTDTFQGPEPSPGSVGSYDDSVPPPKNCYRLVMLG